MRYVRNAITFHPLGDLNINTDSQATIAQPIQHTTEAQTVPASSLSHSLLYLFKIEVLVSDVNGSEKHTRPRRIGLRKILNIFYWKCKMKISFKKWWEDPSRMTGELEKKFQFFYLSALTTTMMLRMVPPVLPHSFAAFRNETGNFLSKNRTRKSK